MIAFWNRREVFAGTGLKEFNRARDILDANKISYDYKYGNAGSLSIPDQSFQQGAAQCYIYVHKKDCEKADFALRDIWYD